MDGLQDGLRLDLADVPQVVFQHPLFHRDLAGFLQVLHAAAAAHAVVRAFRCHPHETGVYDFPQGGHFVAGFFLEHGIGDFFPRQSAFDENHLAIHVRDATAFVVQGFDTGVLFYVKWHFQSPPKSVMARRGAQAMATPLPGAATQSGAR